MRLILTVLILLVASSVFIFFTGGKVFHIARVLPFCSGNPIQWSYELGGLAMLVLFIWGLHRLRRNNRHDDDD